MDAALLDEALDEVVAWFAMLDEVAEDDEEQIVLACLSSWWWLARLVEFAGRVGVVEFSGLCPLHPPLLTPLPSVVRDAVRWTS